ncbi:MAG: type II secretion system F family protein [Rhizobiaceae bacterium]|nr:type II secretion system F family protein [Rhizobiaceae bacterium]
MQNLLSNFDPLLLLSAVGAMAIFTMAYVAFQFFSQNKNRSEVKKRLDLKQHTEHLASETEKGSKPPQKRKQISSSVAKKANDFYSSSDPNSVKKLRMMLIQGGFVNPNAVGYFIAARFGGAALGLIAGVLTAIFGMTSYSTGHQAGAVVAFVAIGYFLPNIYLRRRTSQLETSNRQGFPDILDLMVVSAEAGLTMEASIERISAEIKDIYPNLAMQLNLASLEIRAGRPIDQAIRAFGERLNLEEVKGFATMIQQAKELGTSVSDALRVYSDEMRHKRMMKAEEKAYSLPAKMSIPVTVFILPIVIGIAIIPTIVRWNI